MKTPFRKRFFGRKIGLGRMLLAAWLVAAGAVPLLGLGSAAVSTAMNLIAVGAGVCLFLNR